jgi:ATP-dependent Clp protease ATP-binding subunit ClpC
MANIHLRLPVLVRRLAEESSAPYLVRPLLLPYPISVRNRLEDALSQLRKEIRRAFKGYVLTPHNQDFLLWLTFNADYRYELIDCDFSSERLRVKGKIGVATFNLQKLLIASMPLFNSHYFIVRSGDTGADFKRQTLSIARKLLLKYQRSHGEDFSAKDYFSEKQDFITELRVDVSVSNSELKFAEWESPQQFAKQMEEASFDGVEELEKVGYNLSDRYPDDLRRAFQMDQLVVKIQQLVYSPTPKALALVGREGVGRHTLIHEVVWRRKRDMEIRERELPEDVWHVDPSRVIAGMSVVGMWEKRFESIIHYLRRPRENNAGGHKMLIDNPLALLRIGRSASSNLTLSEVLRVYLERRKLSVILLATPEEWQIIQTKDRRFSELFEVLFVHEPDYNTAMRIIFEQREHLESQYETVITIPAIQQLLAIQRNYRSREPMPGASLKFLELLSVKYRMDRVDAQQVREAFESISGLRESVFDLAVPMDFTELRKRIDDQLIGQPEAANALTDVIHLIKAKLTDKKRPLGVFLFCGPTGVGKTHAAQVLCRFLLGDTQRLIRLDMNEFIDEEAVDRLVGNDNRPEGILSNRVRYQPFGVLLLDEIEKANPRVHDMLLQVLDEGRLTDSLGRLVEFNNIVIIMTANLGADDARTKPGFIIDELDIKASYHQAITRFFRPEFVNRIDKIVVFNPLKREHIMRIARLQVNELLQRDGFVRRAALFNISEAALAWVAERGYDARMGGRALNRQIEQDLTALSAEELIKTTGDGPIIFEIDLRDERLVTKVTPLRFAPVSAEDALPPLPEETGASDFFQQLDEALDRLKTALESEEEESASLMVGRHDQESGSDLWLYFDFKTRLRLTRENIQALILGHRNPRFVRPPVQAMRFKQLSYPAGHEERENLLQEETLEAISQYSRMLPPLFDQHKSEVIGHFLSVAALHIQAQGVTSGEIQKATLQFESLIEVSGAVEINFLMERYVKLFETLDLSHRPDFKRGRFALSGYALEELLLGETGIHLFVAERRLQTPILVRLLKDDVAPAKFAGEEARIIRIYNFGDPGLIVDPRGGYVNVLQMSGEEMALLLFAGLPEETRRWLSATVWE